MKEEQMPGTVAGGRSSVMIYFAGQKKLNLAACIPSRTKTVLRLQYLL
jgi:hypothetical protein